MCVAASAGELLTVFIGSKKSVRDYFNTLSCVQSLIVRS